jgi:hypothetical protein
MITAKSRILFAIVIGVVLTGAAAIGLPYLEFWASPGALLANGLGVGTVHEPGPLGLTTTVATIWLGTFLVWSGVAYGVLAIRDRRRVAKPPAAADSHALAAEPPTVRRLVATVRAQVLVVGPPRAAAHVWSMRSRSTLRGFQTPLLRRDAIASCAAVPFGGRFGGRNVGDL